MKKMLSILAAVGLTATASTSVVSCTKKDQTPVYKSLADVHSWSFTSDNSLIPLSTQDDLQSLSKMVLSTVSTRFKNSADFMTDMTQNNAQAIPDAGFPPSTVAGSDNKALLSFHIQMTDPATKKQVNSATFQMTLYFGKTVLDETNVPKLTVSLVQGQDNTNIMTVIRNIAQDMISNINQIDDYIEITKNGSELMQIDSDLMNQLAAQASLDYVQGINSVTGVRYDSMTQELATLLAGGPQKDVTNAQAMSTYSDVFVNFNKALLTEMANIIAKGNSYSYFNDSDAIARLFNTALSNSGNDLLNQWFSFMAG